MIELTVLLKGKRSGVKQIKHFGFYLNRPKTGILPHPVVMRIKFSVCYMSSTECGLQRALYCYGEQAPTFEEICAYT